MAKVPLKDKFKNRRRRQHPFAFDRKGRPMYSWRCLSCDAGGEDLTIGKMHYGKFAGKEYPHDVIVTHQVEGDMGPIYCF